MKSFVVAMIIAVILFGGSNLYMKKLESVSHELSSINTSVSNAIQKEDYNTAQKEIENMYECIERSYMFFSSMGNHSELDNIETNLSELKGYTEGKSKYDALSKCYALSYLFEHLPANSRLKIENIL